MEYLILASLGLIGAAFSKLLADEFKAWRPSIVSFILTSAVKALPPSNVIQGITQIGGDGFPARLKNRALGFRSEDRWTKLTGRTRSCISYRGDFNLGPANCIQDSCGDALSRKLGKTEFSHNLPARKRATLIFHECTVKPIDAASAESSQRFHPLGG
jgi:hypothetical protein